VDASDVRTTDQVSLKSTDINVAINNHPMLVAFSTQPFHKYEEG